MCSKLIESTVVTIQNIQITSFKNKRPRGQDWSTIALAMHTNSTSSLEVQQFQLKTVQDNKFKQMAQRGKRLAKSTPGKHGKDWSTNALARKQIMLDYDIYMQNTQLPVIFFLV